MDALTIKHASAMPAPTWSWLRMNDTKLEIPCDLERVRAVTVEADEVREYYIIQRLRRESRGGTVEQVGPGLWRCTRYVWDTSEMMNWVKTFIGRIVSLEGDNQAAIDRFYEDVRRLAEMYGGEG